MNEIAPSVEPLALKPKQAARMLGCGVTRLYELMAGGEVDHFLDGRTRLITVASIRARIERKVAAAKAPAAPAPAPTSTAPPAAAPKRPRGGRHAQPERTRAGSTTG